MNPHDYRNATDRHLAEVLTHEPFLADLIRQAEEAEHQTGTRRSLLATALRLTPQVAPDIFGILGRCIERLEVATEVELYVYASAQYNAACTKPENGRVFVLLSSSLAEAFDHEELAFVIGHELGHHIYDHHSVPTWAIQPNSPIAASLALKLRTWQRYAEISADRAGLVCAGGLQPAARSLFKLSSGFHEAPDEARIQAYLDQASELYQEVEQSEQSFQHRDWMSTHPFSPIRLKAAQAFTTSEWFVSDGLPKPRLEEQVQQFMGLMDPSYLDEDSDEAEAMRRVLFAGGVLVAAANGSIDPTEVAALEELLGRGRVPDNLNPDALRADLPHRIRRAHKYVRRARRAQVVRDLALIAQADGHSCDDEVGVLIELADALEVDRGVVHEALRTPVTLD